MCASMNVVASSGFLGLKDYSTWLDSQSQHDFTQQGPAKNVFLYVLHGKVSPCRISGIFSGTALNTIQVILDLSIVYHDGFIVFIELCIRGCHELHCNSTVVGRCHTLCRQIFSEQWRLQTKSEIDLKVRHKKKKKKQCIKVFNNSSCLSCLFNDISLNCKHS